MQGNKMKMALGLPVGAVMNCGDNTGAFVRVASRRLRDYERDPVGGLAADGGAVGAAPVRRCAVGMTCSRSGVRSSVAATASSVCCSARCCAV